MKIRWFKLFAMLAFLAGAQSAYAVTECPVSVLSTYSGGGVFWVVGTNNSQFSIPLTDPNLKTIMASIYMSVAMNKVATFRALADNVDCNSSVVRGDVMGVWFSN
jgi:hypothetical protein